MSVSSIYAKRAVVIAWDAVSWGLAFVGFVLVRHDLELSERMWSAALEYTLSAMLLQIIGGFALHLYLGRNKVGSFAEVTTLGLLVLVDILLVATIFFMVHPMFSRGIAVVVPLLAFLLMAAGRWAYRASRSDGRHPGSESARALVYGAGDVGHQVAGLVDSDADSPYDVVGFIDDDPGKRFLRVRGRRVLGSGNKLVEAARRVDAAVVILAVGKAEPKFIQRLADLCKDAGMTLVVVPPVREMIAGRVELTQLREFNVTDLLGRRQIETDLSEISDYVSGKVVLVTGAGGSIGSELAHQVERMQPAKLIMLDRDESALHGSELRIYGCGLLERDEIVLCDIRDQQALTAVFSKHRPDVVFHAAALKHLPMLERHPEEGWKTNVLGSLNVLRCAAESGVTHFVNISTDKAADATSVLGQTKRIAERLTAGYADATGRAYLSVRFGNVLGSRGSVIDTFRAQIGRGGPVTITHPDVTRFFMTIPEACELVLQAGAIGEPGDVLVLDMGEPVRIIDVARRLMDESRQEVPIVYTGLRQGEKLHEVLCSVVEDGYPSRHEMITRVRVPGLPAESVLVDHATLDDLLPVPPVSASIAVSRRRPTTT